MKYRNIRLVISALLFLASGTSGAQTWLNVRMPDGTYRSFEVTEDLELTWGARLEHEDTSPIEAVDLRLPSGTKWASCNVGALKPEEYGGYYAWGETEEKNWYEWSTYKWCNGTNTSMTKYCTNSSYGTVDNKTMLDLEDDVAHVMWGGDWRIPTYNEFEELVDNCISEWTILNGVKGQKFTSKRNGNSIFLPAAGYRKGHDLHSVVVYGYFWTSSLEEDISVWFGSGYGLQGGSNSDRYCGLSVRPVISGIPWLTLSHSSLKVYANGSGTVKITSGSGNYTVTSSDESKATAIVENDTVTIIGKDVGEVTITVMDTNLQQTATIAVLVVVNPGLEGTWEGDMYTSYYFDYYDEYYDASYSEICFLRDPYRYASGDGYWVDYYNNYGWSRNYIANHITWTVDNGIIKIHFIEDDAYVRIRDYSLNDDYFSGYLELANGKWQNFRLRRVSSPNWGSYYWGYDRSYYGYYSNENKVSMGKTKAKNPEAFKASNTPRRIFRAREWHGGGK